VTAPTSTGTRGGVGAILLVLALGLAFRFIIAYLLPGSGYGVDRSSFIGWAANLAAQGPLGFYDRPFFHDYTPGYLYVLWAVGVVGQAAGGIGDLIKVPPILADLALGWLAWSFVRELGARERWALLGAVLVVFNPVSWFDSVVWGQADSFGLVFLILGIRDLTRDRPERAAIWTVVAALVKPQLGILVPIVAAVTIRRALWPVRPETDLAEADSSSSGSLLDQVRAWERRTGHPIRILTTGLAGFLTAVILCAPFGLTVLDPATSPPFFSSELLDQVRRTAGGYPYLTVNAYNPWALVEQGGNGVAATGGWICDALVVKVDTGGTGYTCLTPYMIGPVPALAVGTALLLVAFVAVSIYVARHPDRLTILAGVAVLTVAFFVLPTRVHERYLYPFLAIGAMFAAFSWRWLVAYVALSLATFLNMYVVLTTLYPNNPGVQDWLGIGTWIRSTGGVTFVVLLNAVTAAWVFLQLRPRARRTLADELETAAAGDGWLGVGGRAEPGMAVGASMRDAMSGDQTFPDVAVSGSGSSTAPMGGASTTAGGTSTIAAASSMAVAAPALTLPRWTLRPSLPEVGPIEWLRARMAERPIRPDRSRELHEEPGGRFDRLDLWIIAILLVATFGARFFRLEEPYQMHFDEVYHARTATEFLQDWRYGINHEIYEWTHPHLAKYAMAAGIELWGENEVSGTSQLGVAVRDAIIEPRRDDPTVPEARGGDRLHVVTGTELRSYDLATRALVASWPIPGATALAIDENQSRLYVGTADGDVLALDLTALDGLRSGGGTASLPGPEAVANVGEPIARLFATADGMALFAQTGAAQPDGLPGDATVVVIDPATGEETGRVEVPGAADFAPAGSAPAIVVDSPPADPAAAASLIVGLAPDVGSAADLEARLRSASGGAVLAGIDGADERAAIQAAIDDGRLAGLTITEVPQVAVAAAEGVVFLSAADGARLSSIPLDGGATGLAYVTELDDPKLYVATGASSAQAPGEVAILTVGGDSAKDGPVLTKTMPMPGFVRDVEFDDATQMVHVLGVAPDASGSTVYAIEAHANAVFADARLPFEPTAWVMDSAALYPAADRQEVIALSGDGSTATVEVGRNPFAWRLPGVIAGVLMAGLLYVLTRLLFRRRSVALMAGLLVLFEGLLFTQSRIGMNDVYVGLFIIAGYTLFAAVWLGRWRWPGAFWLAMPVVGVLLGLALASKWVAVYAIGALFVLWLVRSALGRALLVLGLIAITAILGGQSLTTPAAGSLGNLPFVAIMCALTLIAVAAAILHPISWSLDELRAAVGGPIALAVAVLAIGFATGAADDPITLGGVSITPVQLGLALALLGLGIYGILWFTGRSGFGPLAPPPGPSDPAYGLPASSPPPGEAWLRPGAMLGLPVLWLVVCLVAIPVVVYVVSYIPWALLDGNRLTASWPPGHTGQTLLDLTGAMYRYHDSLSAGHAASSPWWAWPFDLKPVWFYQDAFAGGTSGAIYDAGSLVIFWLGIPAMAFVAWQAWARRSLPLALVAIAFACQWLPWARIDRAAFQYHYYTSIPFLVIALAYFLAEVWHGASKRTWLLIRVAAAVAVMGPVLMWVSIRPLCAVVGVERANPGSQACAAVIPDFVLTLRALAIAVVLVVGVIALLRLVANFGRAERRSAGLTPTLVGLAVAAAVGAVLLVGVLPDTPILALSNVPVEPVAILLGLPLVPIAVIILTARDGRRVVLGALAAAAAWFVVVYPNFSGLPLPSAFHNTYQGILPTYLYAFQFPVATVRGAPTPLIGMVPLLLAAVLGLTCVVVGYSAWIWRLSNAEREASGSRAGPAGPAGSYGTGEAGTVGGGGG
jgi:Gpi18-like mannosyltransferase